jgi:hypothetical protein
MISPWSELYLYNPDTAYLSGRVDRARPFLDQVKLALDRYEELERPKAKGSEFDVQWCRPYSTASGHTRNIIASLLILLAICGSILLFQHEYAEEQAAQPVASKAAEPERR